MISGSRASLAGIFVLAIILFVNEGFKFNVKSILFSMFVIMISLNVLLTSDWFVDQWEVVKHRNQVKESTFESEWQIRGYDRITLYPEYILYGAGEMANKRFVKSYQQLEMHSAFGTILFSYGIIGFSFLKILISNYKTKPILQSSFITSYPSL